MDVQKADIIVAVLRGKAPRATARFNRQQNAHIVLPFDRIELLLDLQPYTLRDETIFRHLRNALHNLVSVGIHNDLFHERLVGFFWKIRDGSGRLDIF